MSLQQPTRASAWPLFELIVRTPRIELRYVDGDSAAALMELVALAGIHDPSSAWDLPFAVF